MSNLVHQNDYQGKGQDLEKRKKDFERFFRLFYPDLCNYAFGFVQNRAVAKDIVQSVFLNIWEQEKFEGNTESAKPYLYKSIRNKALNYKKHQQVKQECIPELEARVREWGQSNKAPDNEEKVALIREGINSLPDRCQEIFRLSRESGMTYKEIAEILDLSISTVETQMGRAFKKLRAFANNYWDQAILLMFASMYML